MHLALRGPREPGHRRAAPPRGHPASRSAPASRCSRRLHRVPRRARAARGAARARPRSPSPLLRSALAGSPGAEPELRSGPDVLAARARRAPGDLGLVPGSEEAMEVAQAAVEDAFRTAGDYEKARTLVLRSRMAFRLGQFSLGRADGLAALDRAERLREQQRSMPLRLRYAQSLSFAYQSLAGALTRYRAPGDDLGPRRRLPGDGAAEGPRAHGDAARRGPARRADPGAAADARAGAGRAPAGRGAALVPALALRADDGCALPRGELVGDAGHPGAGRGVPGPGADDLGRQIRAWTGLRRAPRWRRTGRPGGGSTASFSGRRSRPFRHRSTVWSSSPTGRSTGCRSTRSPRDRARRTWPSGSGSPSSPRRRCGSMLRAAPRLPPGKAAGARRSGGRLRRPARSSARSGVFGALAHARREAQAALAAFPGGSELRTGPPASEAFLKGGRAGRGVDAPLRHPRGHRRAGPGARRGRARPGQRRRRTDGSSPGRLPGSRSRERRWSSPGARPPPGRCTAERG